MFEIGLMLATSLGLSTLTKPLMVPIPLAQSSKNFLKSLCLTIADTRTGHRRHVMPKGIESIGGPVSSRIGDSRLHDVPVGDHILDLRDPAIGQRLGHDRRIERA